MRRGAAKGYAVPQEPTQPVYATVSAEGVVTLTGTPLCSQLLDERGTE